jgi:hypothetical protein
LVFDPRIKEINSHEKPLADLANSRAKAILMAMQEMISQHGHSERVV